eukprot:TRINITY_DN4966_c0_g4_i1.p2 TRINITY_DN4966_c0_g4~~TRINITY_DN4966_c0_g4_i1.p2  ORF type:complete len:166 (-),score=36.85 TRINITY_DN4966_c0_g4_i1:137-634(-)
MAWTLLQLWYATCRLRFRCSLPTAVSIRLNAFTFNPAGVLQTIVPSRVGALGGTVVTLTGINLSSGFDATEVTLAGVTAIVLSQTTSTVTVQSAAVVGSITGDAVVWSTQFGSTVLVSAFEYIATRLDDIHPVNGPNTGNNRVTISGVLGFADVTLVEICGLARP